MKKFLTALGAIVVVLLIVGGILRWVTSPGGPLPGDGPGGSAGPGGEAAPPEAAQPPECPAVEVIAAPGTWESSAQDDPTNPQANPMSFMLGVTRPVQGAFPPEQVKVWTLPYPAQFRNINALQEMTYDDSREQGTQRLRAELVDMHTACPLTDFILTGFSQGAVIVGDLASEIGGPAPIIDPARVRGVALVADGRKLPGEGITAGVPTGGVGAEIALRPFEGVVQPIVPGASMRGPRPGGFGGLADRTIQICAPGDVICDAPANAGDAVARAGELVAANGIHAQYSTNPHVFDGTTTDQWLVGWVRSLIGG